MASTKGTSATIAAQSSGRIVVDRPHQEATGRHPASRDAALLGHAAFEEVFGRGDEVGEGVDLVAHAAALVPQAAHLPASSDVRDGEDDPPVEERELGGIEPRVDRRFVSAIAIEESGSREDQVLSVDQTDRDFDVIDLCPDPSLDVLRGVVVRGRGLFDDGLFPGVEIDVDHSPRRQKRFVGEPESGCLVVEVLTDSESIGRLLELDFEAIAFIGDDGEGWIAVPTPGHHQMSGEGEDPSDLAQWVVRYHLGRFGDGAEFE